MTDGSFIQSSSKVYVRASVPQMFSTGFSPDVFGKSIQPICSLKCPKAHIVFFWFSLEEVFLKHSLAPRAPPPSAVLSNVPHFQYKMQYAVQGVDGSTQEDQLVLFIHSSPPNTGRHPKRCFAAAVSFHFPSVSASSLRFCRTRFTLLFTGFYCKCCIAPTFSSLNSSSSPTCVSQDFSAHQPPFIHLHRPHPNTATFTLSIPPNTHDHSAQITSGSYRYSLP